MNVQNNDIFLLFPQNLRFDLEKNIKNLSDFKIVMNAIKVIQSTTLSTELQIKEIQETYNILEEHQIKVIKFLFLRLVSVDKVICKSAIKKIQ